MVGLSKDSAQTGTDLKLEQLGTMFDPGWGPHPWTRRPLCFTVASAFFYKQKVLELRSFQSHSSPMRPVTATVTDYAAE